MGVRRLTCRSGHSWDQDEEGALPADLRQICPECAGGFDEAMSSVPAVNPSAPTEPEKPAPLQFEGFQILDVLKRRAPIDFSFVAVNIDSGYDGYEHHKITETCAARGWELHVEHTDIGETIEDILADSETPCSLCARLRRGALYRLATKVGASKIALGHHADDFIETLLLNVFFQGSIKAMPARLVSDNRQHVVIRPLVYVLESEARQYAKQSNLPIIGYCCPACGDLSLQRQRTKRLLYLNVRRASPRPP